MKCHKLHSWQVAGASSLYGTRYDNWHTRGRLFFVIEQIAVEKRRLYGVDQEMEPDKVLGVWVAGDMASALASALRQMAADTLSRCPKKTACRGFTESTQAHYRLKRRGVSVKGLCNKP